MPKQTCFIVVVIVFFNWGKEEGAKEVFETGDSE